ncbi:FGGY-family carbohydrate kinase [Sphingobacterium hotanense]|uniref:FGGY-family carbohydrate kinase n=1 Tax=Sphingobacterium hotanense TaxID=649196 RepID=A0ABT7NR05_9SPHI|nr:FGGY-family carbohydrate kinase [Sphingobacterium hotanense]MDM1049580.1 FGGY-family carbohydrate kinase [Sphingobacterium hotanense]
MDKYFFGVDVGTQGARIILVDQQGKLIASDARKFNLDDRFREEQSPDLWWQDCQEMMADLISALPVHINKSDILALSVTSTSGTVIPLDKDLKPLHDAIMYSDPRSVEQGKRCKEIASKYVKDGYTGFNASSGISKMLWFIETYPEKAEQISLWVHASDYIVGKFSGNYHTTDYTNVLKSAYDLEKLEWPAFVTQEIGLKPSWLQEVVPSGTVVGKLDADLAATWGIPRIDVVVGMTDGCATQMASGAVRPGTWNTTIGTTLVIKGVTKTNVVDPLGRLYSHRHPEGYWMPGGASNTGADWISLDFAENLQELNDEAEKLIPTGLLAWPLKQEGERYPIMAPQARAFFPENASRAALFTSGLEGVAFIERLAYEIIEDLSGEKVEAVYSAGGGSNSDVWLKIRASVMNVPIFKCKEASGAFGAAIMAASNTYYTSLIEAASAMTQIEKVVQPDTTLQAAYEEQYQAFKQKLSDLNYL